MYKNNGEIAVGYIAQSCILTDSAIAQQGFSSPVCGDLLGAVVVVQSDRCRKEGPALSLCETQRVKQPVAEGAALKHLIL